MHISWFCWMESKNYWNDDDCFLLGYVCIKSFFCGCGCIMEGEVVTSNNNNRERSKMLTYLWMWWWWCVFLLSIKCIVFQPFWVLNKRERYIYDGFGIFSSSSLQVISLFQKNYYDTAHCSHMPCLHEQPSKSIILSS